ncbi:MAG: hypothetical protein LBC10_03955 [Deltaproteobacteria bacterium]|jgi:hypothetical protein|nr:hypothetical protein [Deltaproteobacteria bacterium]
MAIGTISAEYGNILGNFAPRNILRANTVVRTPSMSSADNNFGPVSVHWAGFGAKRLDIPLYDLASTYADDSRYIAAKKQSLKIQNDMALRQNAILTTGRWDATLAGSYVERAHAGIKAARKLEGEKDRSAFEHSGENLEAIKNDVAQRAEEAKSSGAAEHAAAKNVQDSENAAMRNTAEAPADGAGSHPQILTKRAQSYLVSGASAASADTSANTAEPGLHVRA